MFTVCHFYSRNDFNVSHLFYMQHWFFLFQIPNINRCENEVKKRNTAKNLYLRHVSKNSAFSTHATHICIDFETFKEKRFNSWNLSTQRSVLKIWNIPFNKLLNQRWILHFGVVLFVLRFLIQNLIASFYPLFHTLYNSFIFNEVKRTKEKHEMRSLWHDVERYFFFVLLDFIHNEDSNPDPINLQSKCDPSLLTASCRLLIIMNDDLVTCANICLHRISIYKHHVQQNELMPASIQMIL